MVYPTLIIIGSAACILMAFSLVNIYFLRFSSGRVNIDEMSTEEDVLRERIRRKNAVGKAVTEYLHLKKENSNVKAMFNRPVHTMEDEPKEKISMLGKRPPRRQKE